MDYSKITYGGAMDDSDIQSAYPCSTHTMKGRPFTLLGCSPRNAGPNMS